jgi:hypothetical protein
LKSKRTLRLKLKLIYKHPNYTQKYRYCIIKSNPEALHDWAISLKQRYPDQQIAEVCELKKGPLIYTLAKYSHLTLFTINPSTVAKYRKAFAPSGAKDAPSDAFVQVEILTLHMAKPTAIEPE